MHQIQQEFSERHMAVLLVTKTICTKIPASIQLSLAARRLQDSAAKVITSINNSSTVRPFARYDEVSASGARKSLVLVVCCCQPDCVMYTIALILFVVPAT